MGNSGMYQGSLSDDGVITDYHNNYRGKIEDDHIIGSDGSYNGKLDADGNIFDENGRYIGRKKDN